jgi:uncharacterized protein
LKPFEDSLVNAVANIHIGDIEKAINYWREKQPPLDGMTLAAQPRVLAEVYALMIFHRQTMIEENQLSEAAMTAWKGWYDTTIDAPCIAICSTSQGDEMCKGCGRTFDEVQNWIRMTPVQKRDIWFRITQEGTSWRFGRYSDRALENR